MQLVEPLQKVRRYFFEMDLAAESFSRVDEYFRNLDRAVTEQVRERVEKKAKEAQGRAPASSRRCNSVIASAKPGSNKPSNSWASGIVLKNTAKQVMQQIEALKQPREPVRA